MVDQTANIELEYIFGFNNEMRNGVKYLDNENILFVGGNYLVIENIREKK